jgi:hypothetical protein
MSCTQKCWVYHVISGNHKRRRPRRGLGWRKGGNHLKKKGFSRAKKRNENPDRKFRIDFQILQ